MTGSKDGFTSEAFKKLCVNQGPTLVAVQSTLDRVFGGFTSVSWQQGYFESSDDTAFIYSLDKDTIHRPYRNQEYTIWGCGILAFGAGFSDIFINNQFCNTGKNSHCNLGNTYSLPAGLIF